MSRARGRRRRAWISAAEGQLKGDERERVSIYFVDVAYRKKLPPLQISPHQLMLLTHAQAVMEDHRGAG